MDYMIRNIPDNLWNKFKATCATQGKTMLSVIIELIEKYIAEKK